MTKPWMRKGRTSSRKPLRLTQPTTLPSRLTVQQYRLLTKQPLTPRRNKYNNRKTEYNGRVYHSKREANRAQELDILKRVGDITEWCPQPEFRIEHNGKKICSYVADFRVVYPDGRVEFEDVKGVKTDVYRLKKKLVEAFYGIIIKEL